MFLITLLEEMKKIQKKIHKIDLKWNWNLSINRSTNRWTHKITVIWDYYMHYWLLKDNTVPQELLSSTTDLTLRGYILQSKNKYKNFRFITVSWNTPVLLKM